MPSFYPITYEEMDTFLTTQGFAVIYLPKVAEMVYGKVIDKNVCVRVYTGIVGEISRDKGNDAIRVVVVKRFYNGTIKPITSNVSRVNRTEGWKENLQKRIDNVTVFYYSNLKLNTALKVNTAL